MSYGGDRRPRRLSSRGTLGGRAAWGLADQGISSLTNFTLSVMIARSASASVFGAFALAFAAYALILNVGNGAIGEPLAVKYSDAPTDVWRRVAAAATGSALMLGLVAASACAAVGMILGGAQRSAFLVLAVSLPGLVVQDTWRKLFFARFQGKLSFINDLVWASLFLLALALVVSSRHTSVVSLMALWGGAGTIAAVAGCLQGRVLPRPSAAAQWFREHRDLASRFVAELMLLSGAQQAAIYVIGATAGLPVVGGIRGAEVVLGPLYVLVIGVRMMAVPEAVVLLRESPGRMRRGLVFLAVGLTAASLGVGALASLVPESLGTELLGLTWTAAQQALIPAAVILAATAASMSALVGLRALGAAGRSLRARLLAAPLICVGAAIGGAFGTTRTAAWGMAIGMSLGVLNWWRQLHLALKEHGRHRG